MAQRPKTLLVCQSTDFKVDYAINPWMQPGASDPAKAARQWQNLVEILKGAGVAVEVARFPADAPQEVIWTRDEYALINGQPVLARFKHEVRQQETPYYQRWFKDHGYRPVQADGLLEGGNLIEHGGRYYMGTGVRAEAADCQRLAEQLNIEVVPLPVTSDDFFHIDLAFISLDDQTAFYYPPAFTPEATEALKSHIPNLQELSEAEMSGYCANSIALGDTVIMQAGNGSFKQKLEALGKQVVEVDVSEFKNIGGGGIHCLTNVLEWS